MKPRIVCVDPDAEVLGALRDALRPRGRAWDLTFFADAAEALAGLCATRPDVVVADPELAGAGVPFLLDVEARWPRGVRIALARGSLGAVEPADRLRPHLTLSGTGPLLAALDLLAERRAALPEPELAARAVAQGGLPPSPATFRALFEAVGADAPPAELARLAERDVAVTAKILQLAGPGGGGVRAALASLDGDLFQHALLALGGVARPDEAALEAANEHARQVARAAALLVPDPALREGAYLAGLLHDVGELVAPAHEAPHAELGAYLLAVWGLPAPVVDAVAYHHRPSAQSADDVTLADVVHFAETVVAADATALDAARLAQLSRSGQLDRWRKGAAAPTSDRT
ncbi:MAG TPA: HDOD domain-containing protein [Haliangiales bacterium]|nr:HDOD domain-containing protein [Haliangiales bacterium]